MVNKGEYIVPWTRQKSLKEKYLEEEVPDITELCDIIDGIKIGTAFPEFHTCRAKALFAMYYLTGCRASEVTKCMDLRVMRDKEVMYKHNDFHGIKKKHIKLGVIDGHKCLIVRTENRKNRSRKSKRLPIPIELEAPIAAYLFEYLKRLKPDMILFPFGAKRATQIINTTGFNIHFIRHIRATHLITKYDFNEQLLIKYMGWTDARPAKYYMHLKSFDIFRQFYK